MPKKLHIKTGDQVMVIAGAYKGSTGEVLEMMPALNRAVVDGVSLQKKHQKKTEDQDGGIIEQNGSIHLSNIMLIDPKSGEATRIGRKKEGGKSVRYSKKSGEIIE